MQEHPGHPEEQLHSLGQQILFPVTWLCSLRAQFTLFATAGHVLLQFDHFPGLVSCGANDARNHHHTRCNPVLAHPALRLLLGEVHSTLNLNCRADFAFPGFGGVPLAQTDADPRGDRVPLGLLRVRLLLLVGEHQDHSTGEDSGCCAGAELAGAHVRSARSTQLIAISKSSLSCRVVSAGCTDRWQQLSERRSRAVADRR